MKNDSRKKVDEVLALLDRHHQAFYAVADIARETGHPVPMDTRGWSQIIVSVLTGITGLKNKKGADLIDGSDVKGANTWKAIDTPRFNGVIKAGTKAEHSGKLTSLDSVPYLFLVLWDVKSLGEHRCRIWCVRPMVDGEFRAMCKRWYDDKDSGKVKSDNFQLQPPRGQNTNRIHNSWGDLLYPLLFCAEQKKDKFSLVTYDLDVLKSGLCTPLPQTTP